MKRELGLTIGTALFLCGAAFAQADRPAANPWLEESDRLPPLAHNVVLTISLNKPQIGRFDPLIVRVTLSNRDAKPLTIETRKDGAPYNLASMVARGDGAFERCDQWLMRNSPEYRDRDLRATLQTGESTEGEFLILFGGPPTGLPFAEPGRYAVRVACQPDAQFAPIYSNEVLVIVSPNDGGNAAFLRDLDELSYAYHGYDREAMRRNVGAEYHVGIDLLKRIIGENRPHLIAPDENPQDRKEAELVDSLAALLERHRNSAYSGYIARFLGLVYVKTFEHEVSLAEGRVWKETGKAPQTTREELVSHPAYEKALRYLTMAEEAELWPPTTATLHVGRLHVMAQEWEKAEAAIGRLRAQPVGSKSPDLISKLETELTGYKKKLEERAAKRRP